MKTPFGQNSTQRGFPVLAQPSHLSEKVIGNHGPSELAKTVHLSIFLHSPYFCAMFSTVGFADHPKVVLNLRMRYTLIGSLIRNVTVSV